MAKRLGVDAETLRAEHPQLIYCSITGYGQEWGPSDHAGHDLNHNAVTGILGVTGNQRSGPVVPGTPIADLVGGGFQAVTAILAALIQRGKTGEGCVLDVAMSEGVLAMLVLAQARMAGGAGEPGLGDDLLTGLGGSPNLRNRRRSPGCGRFRAGFWQRSCSCGA